MPQLPRISGHKQKWLIFTGQTQRNNFLFSGLFSWGCLVLFIMLILYFSNQHLLNTYYIFPQPFVPVFTVAFVTFWELLQGQAYLFHGPSQILRFLQTEGLWQLCVEWVCWHQFPSSICSLCVSRSHFGNPHDISSFFIIMTSVMVICDQY